MKEKYIHFCLGNNSVPVFGQPWFLDLVSEGKWNVVLTEDKVGMITGAWPYIIQRRIGFTFLQMPPYTPFLGPYIFYPSHEQSEYKRNSFYSRIMQDLEKQLPKSSYTSLKLSPENEIWYPLYSKKYVQTSRYTYVIDYKIGIEKITNNLKPQLRNVVLKEEHDAYISISKDYDGFLKLLGDTFNKNGIGQFFHGDIIRKLVTQAVSRNQGCLYSYKDMSAVIFVLEDGQRSYLLFTAKDEVGKEEEGVALLIWRAIQESIAKNKDFDFEGSMLPGVEKFFRSFGGRQQAYHQISRITNPFLKLYKFLRP